MSDMRLVVAGAAGRMGRMLVQAIHATPGLALAGRRLSVSTLLFFNDGAGVGASGVAGSNKKNTPSQPLKYAGAADYALTSFVNTITFDAESETYAMATQHRASWSLRRTHRPTATSGAAPHDGGPALVLGSSSNARRPAAPKDIVGRSEFEW